VVVEVVYPVLAGWCGAEHCFPLTRLAPSALGTLSRKGRGEP
jgi:hypothetical protein